MKLDSGARELVHSYLEPSCLAFGFENCYGENCFAFTWRSSRATISAKFIARKFIVASYYTNWPRISCESTPTEESVRP